MTRPDPIRQQFPLRSLAQPRRPQQHDATRPQRHARRRRTTRPGPLEPLCAIVGKSRLSFDIGAHVTQSPYKPRPPDESEDILVLLFAASTSFSDSAGYLTYTELN